MHTMKLAVCIMEEEQMKRFFQISFTNFQNVAKMSWLFVLAGLC